MTPDLVDGLAASRLGKISSGLRHLDKPGDKIQEAVLGGTGAVFCFVI
jgi:hypothetical protein